MYDLNNQERMTVEQLLEFAKRTRDEVDGFVSAISADTVVTFFDAMGVSLVVKEMATFDDVYILVKHNRFEGAKVRLRSIWESLIILKYVVHSAIENDVAAKALYLCDENKRVNIAQNNGFWNILPADVKDERQKLADEYKSLDADLKTFAKRPLEQMHDEIVKIDPASLPPIQIGSISVGQYDVVFRTFSELIHGGLPGSRNQVQQWMEDSSISAAKIEAETEGTLTSACALLCNIINVWVKHSSEEHYSEAWNDSCSTQNLREIN